MIFILYINNFFSNYDVFFLGSDSLKISLGSDPGHMTRENRSDYGSACSCETSTFIREYA